MSTRSWIVARNTRGEWVGTYCHFDGYPTGVGKALLARYSTREAALKLIDANGGRSLSSITGEKPLYSGASGGAGVLTAPKMETHLEDARTSWCEFFYWIDDDDVWHVRSLRLPQEGELKDILKGHDPDDETLWPAPAPAIGSITEDEMIQEISDRLNDLDAGKIRAMYKAMTS